MTKSANRIFLSSYVGKTVVAHLSDGSTLTGEVKFTPLWADSLYSFNVYPYEIGGWDIDDSGNVSETTLRIMKIEVQSPRFKKALMAHRYPDMDLTQFAGKRVFVRMGKEAGKRGYEQFVSEVKIREDISGNAVVHFRTALAQHLGNFLPNGKAANGSGKRILEIYEEGAYEITLQKEFNGPVKEDPTVSAAVEALSKLSPEQVHTLIQSIKGNQK